MLRRKMRTHLGGECSGSCAEFHQPARGLHPVRVLLTDVGVAALWRVEIAVSHNVQRVGERSLDRGGVVRISHGGRDRLRYVSGHPLTFLAYRFPKAGDSYPCCHSFLLVLNRQLAKVDLANALGCKPTLLFRAHCFQYTLGRLVPHFLEVEIMRLWAQPEIGRIAIPPPLSLLALCADRMDFRDVVAALLLTTREHVVKAIADVLAAERMKDGQGNGALGRSFVSAAL